MIYPKNIEEKLGFDKVRRFIKDECISSLGQGLVDEVAFSNDPDEIDRLTGQVVEFCDILQQEESFPQQNYIDARKHLIKAAPIGAFLGALDFYDLKLSLRAIYDCLIYFTKRPEEAYPYLRAIINEVAFDPELVDKIELVIDDRGKIRDDASFQLRSIRAQIIEEQNHLRKRLEQILKDSKKHGYTVDDSALTVRDGRLVIPVVAEHKRKIKGFIHDESATGQTVFLEPAEVIDRNNIIRELKYEERREMVRILTKLTDELRPEIENLRQAYHFLGRMDFIQAKAKLAVKMKAVKPLFAPKRQLNWVDARHPLLYLNFKELGKEVIPLNIRLDAAQRILLISGPNAGGKSVALKTVGLVQYMFQCGLLVPMGEGSEVGLFKDIFIDIGDEQSLEDDLSTYSSHLANMKYFLKLADKHTLFLIDEFGTGTEPVMGGAIAEAILEKLYEAKAYGVITTHYANLKLYAEDKPGIVNGAMQFDVTTLSPAYQLDIGKPGSSFAFEIAQKTGLPQEIILNARKKAGSQKVNFDDLLRELEAEKKSLSLKNQLVKAKEKKLNEVTDEYANLKAYLDQEKKRIINQARQEAQNILKETNQRIESTIREIRESQAEKQKTKQLRQKLESLKEELKPEPVEEKPAEVAESNEVKVENGIIALGDLVRIKGQSAIGEVMSMKGKDVEILIGDLKSNVKLNRLEKISKRGLKREEKKVKKSIKGIDISERMANFSTNLDLRGKRGEEALVALESFMDEALLLSQTELRIVHGKGNGVLRSLIRDQLRKRREVKNLRDEHVERGGAGVTLVTLDA